MLRKHFHRFNYKKGTQIRRRQTLGLNFKSNPVLCDCS